ncbi:MAG: hypothetical protein V4509_02085 [Patescibacteria group bacterium]
MKSQQLRSHIINTLFLSGFFVALVASFVRYYYLKEFPVHIEVSCDPTTEKCFHRDCDTDECPPNGLEDYRQFDLPGNVFTTCSEVDGCSDVCKKEQGTCEEIVCGDNEEDVCSTQ